jgi:peroxiredoxin
MKRTTISVVALFTFLYSFIGHATSISGFIENINTSRINCAIVSRRVTDKPITIIIPFEKGKFHHELQISECTYLSLSDGTNYFSGFIQPGDSIVVRYNASDFQSSLAYSGKGKEKFEISDLINQLKIQSDNEVKHAKDAPFPVDQFFGKTDSMESKITASLVSAKQLMTTDSYNQLTGYLRASMLRVKYNGLIALFGDSFDKILDIYQDRLTPLSKQNMASLLVFDDTLGGSLFYVKMVESILSLYFEENIQPQLGKDLAGKYQYLSSKLPRNLKAPVLFFFVNKDINENRNVEIESIITNSFAAPKDSIFHRLASQKLSEARMLKAGMLAPDFVLEDLNGKKVNLSSFKGKVVYLDFWFGGCGPCHQLFNAIKPVKKYFQSDTNVVFLVVSIDDKETWKKAVNKFQIQGYHAFTENKFRDHSIIKSYQVNGYPSTYIITASGKLHTVEPSKDPDTLKDQIQSALLKANK